MRKPFVLILLLCAAVALAVAYQYAENNAARNEAPALRTSYTVTLGLPAVDLEGAGALATLAVTVTDGDGSVFVRFDSSKPLINTETQSSLRLALDVAERLTKENLSKKNIYYSITAPSDAVGGHSAGAAAAIATIAALRGEELKNDTLVTGKLGSGEGSIAQVGRVEEKAAAVKTAGYTTFLVPKGEGVEEDGLRVVEVSTVAEAYALMRK
ncbi:Archaeal Lon protease [Candidatus Norongarragalina meridionalis]|nr:Archaeal Lon protease [Candidatus Norongarragalina meridionalis]